MPNQELARVVLEHDNIQENGNCFLDVRAAPSVETPSMLCVMAGGWRGCTVAEGMQLGSAAGWVKLTISILLEMTVVHL